MSARPEPPPASDPSPRPARQARAWLLLIHQLPARPSNLRVRTWRRLQQVGALAVKHAAYALPDSPAAREDFEWLKTEIEGVGGSASIFVADAVDTWSHDALVDEFRRTREASYTDVARDAERTLRRLESGRRGAAPSRRDVDRLRERVSAIERVDFFGSAGRDRVLGLVRRIEEAARGGTAPGHAASSEPPASYNERLWVTRPRPGVDRMASAWLITRFIDPAARFDFVADRNAAPPNAVPFDMFGVEFTHRGQLCTFEALCESFQLNDPSLPRIAAIVHDVDLKDGRFGAAEAPAIGSIIDGLQLAHPDDQHLLAAGMALFEALYLRFAQAERTSGPRPLAKRPAKTRSRSSRPRSR